MTMTLKTEDVGFDDHRISNMRFDHATLLWIGKRERQEDAALSSFDDDQTCGVVVLADGMGGHTSGEIASALVTEEVFDAISRDLPSMLQFKKFVPNHLRAAAISANQTVKEVISAHPEFAGMGSTLVALFVDGNELFWVSIGDSPLYRIRNGEIARLNEDHSMAADIDLMVANGMMSAEVGKNHPDRQCLKSAVAGMEIRMIHCPDLPSPIEPGDIFVLSSDGLQTIPDESILKLVWSERDDPSDVIANSLLSAVKFEDDPIQDNTSIIVLKASELS